MFCPECRAEFVDTVASCAHCEVALVAELPDVDPFSTAEGMVALLEGKETQALVVGNHVALQEVQKILGERRIASVIAGEAGEEIEAAMHARFYLMVAEDTLDSARAVLAEDWKQGVDTEGLMHKDTPGIDAEVPADEASPCPACGEPVPPSAGECPDCGLFVGALEE